MTSRAEFWKTVQENFWHSLKIIAIIFFHGTLFLFWILFDAGAHHVCEIFQTHGLHEYCAIAFRWVASIAVFALAATPLICDILTAIGIILRKVRDTWNLRP